MTDEISTSEAAGLVGVSDKTIRDWCRADRVKYRQVGFRKAYKVDREDLIRLATELGCITEPGN
jgi:excisionase family DNA binding protein